jgi:hypothetical protein
MDIFLPLVNINQRLEPIYRRKDVQGNLLITPMMHMEVLMPLQLLYNLYSNS